MIQVEYLILTVEYLTWKMRRLAMRCRQLILALCLIVVMVCIGFNRSYRYLPPQELISQGNIFREYITQHERELYKSLLVIFGDAAQKLNMTYFLADGSLIGSVRHHGMIPWDDDLDVGVLRLEEDKMHKMHDILPENVQLFENWFRWKMCFKGRPRVRFGRGWTFPTLDIGFYAISRGQTWDENWKSFKAAQMDLDVVFPLIKRPFMGLMIPAPHRPHKYIEMNFKSDVMTLCASPTFSHRTGFFSDPYLRRTVRCEALWSLYPFVQRTVLKKLGSSVLANETLIFNGNILSSVVTQF